MTKKEAKRFNATKKIMEFGATNIFLTQNPTDKIVNDFMMNGSKYVAEHEAAHALVMEKVLNIPYKFTYVNGIPYTVPANGIEYFDISKLTFNESKKYCVLYAAGYAGELKKMNYTDDKIIEAAAKMLMKYEFALEFSNADDGLMYKLLKKFFHKNSERTFNVSLAIKEAINIINDNNERYNELVEIARSAFDDYKMIA